MTYDPESGTFDHSAQTRFTLWEDAKPLIDSNLLIGTGFNTYAYLHRVGEYEDTHNYYVKVLVETGVVGLLIFGWLLWTTLWRALRLFRQSRDPFLASLGFGLAAWLITAAAASLFGDRWTFMQVNGYMWVLGGMVSHALLAESESKVKSLEPVRSRNLPRLQESYVSS